MAKATDTAGQIAATLASLHDALRPPQRLTPDQAAAQGCFPPSAYAAHHGLSVDGAKCRLSGYARDGLLEAVKVKTEGVSAIQTWYRAAQ